MKRLVPPRSAWLAPLALLAAPLLATLWTRATNTVKLPRTREALPNMVYVTRDWNVAVTAIEVSEKPSTTPGTVLPVWVFYCRNTDSAPHYISITVQLQTLGRRDLVRFSMPATLAPNHKEDFPLEIASKVAAGDWSQAVFARVTVDFLSEPGK